MSSPTNNHPCNAARAAAGPLSRGRPTRVLIVEDSSIVRERLLAIVSAIENVVVAGQAHDGFSAQELFRSCEPDAVVLDIQLPGIDGLGLLEEFKAARPECMVIILTTYAFEEFRQRCTALGAEHFFDKTTQFDQIPQALRALRKPAQQPTPGTQ